jgi:transcriptional regulator with PAS, ATPase and Fis domain
VTSVKRTLAEVSGQSSTNEETTVPDPGSDQFMIGKSSPIREIKTYLHKIATTDSTALISGETGTGKGLAAELIHRNSSRYKKPFVSVNCAALPESLIESELFGHERGAFTGATTLQRGKFELASGGTVFLDEIGDMNLYAQTKILRTIEKKEVYRLGGKKNIPIDIRIIAATNQEPERLLENGEFRKDLYYRLNVARVHMPPLRDRKEDIPLLLNHYIQEMNRYFGRNIKGFTKDANNTLLYYNWPGNVRELKNVVEAAFINLPPENVDLVELPKSFLNRLKLSEHSSDSERDRMLAILFETNWNKSKAAQKLHWSRMTLYRKMAKYHIMIP